MDGYWLDWEIQEWCPDLRFEREQRNKLLYDSIWGLTPRERSIIILRFGLDEDKDFTLTETGERFDLSRERIRQIEAKAMRKIRKNERLKEFLNEDPRPQLYLSPMTLYS
jgi:RNA polymerase sigma factor (sigma-70 family)